VQWVPFNEGWGEYDNGRIVDLVRSLDNTRLINHNSGSNCCLSDPEPANGDIVDDHAYQVSSATRLPTATRVAVLGEYGGLGRRVAGHEYQPGAGFGYGDLYPDEASLTARYVQITGQVRGFITGRGLSASVYTEPYDVENEVNGFWTYDRRILKMTEASVRAVNQSLLDAARGLGLVTNELVSLRVTTAGLTNRYLRHANPLARTDVVTATSADALKQDATFWLRPGLANAGCYSFESRNNPGHFLRHSGYRVRKDPNDNTALFRADATFCAREGLGGGGTSFESFNFPGRFIRHVAEEVWISANGGPNPWDNPTNFGADSTWAVAAAWWRSGADLPLNQTRSLRVVTPGFTDRYLRHTGGLARTDVVNAASAAALRNEATFWIRRGLADPTCYSFESRTAAGQFLRHADFRVRMNANDGSALFAQDATFCAQPGRSGSGTVTLASYNVAGTSIRHFAEEVWIASQGGTHPYDSPTAYNEDVSWAVSAAWAP